MFGGEGRDSTGSFGDLNDFWKYSPASGQWTWIDGSDTANATGVYGTEGVAAATNVPGPRFGPDEWVDGSGNLWLFGGWYDAGGPGPNDHLNDLWKYSPSSGD